MRRRLLTFEELVARMESAPRATSDEWAVSRRYVRIESLSQPAITEPSLEDPRPAIDATHEEVALDLTAA